MFKSAKAKAKFSNFNEDTNLVSTWSLQNLCIVGNDQKTIRLANLFVFVRSNQVVTFRRSWLESPAKN